MDKFQLWGLTLACELPVMMLLARPQPAMRILIVAASASGLTHLVAWYVMSTLSLDDLLIGLLFMEIGIILAEAVWYRIWLSTRFGKSLWWSLLTNGMSFAVVVAWSSLSW